MIERKTRTASMLAAAAFFVVCGSGLSALARAQEQPQAQAEAQGLPECSIDLTLPGMMSDILSNALTRSFRLPPRQVSAFLADARGQCKTGQELLKAAARHFKLSEELLTAKVEKYKHCNCSHPAPETLHPALLVDPQPHPDCDVNLKLTGNMSDLVSNALTLGLKIPARDVQAFLADAKKKLDDEDGGELMKGAAEHFKISEDVLAAEVLKFKHCNCEHPGGGKDMSQSAAPRPDDGLPVSAFAKNVTLHVVLHEIGHGLIREFDIPILGNEETMADAFATYYLTTYMPGRALDAITARVTSLMIEAGEAPEIDWSGEHDHDARRANQIAALAMAADPIKYEPVAAIVGMSEGDIKKAVDYGGEIHRSWRRVLTPLWMPQDEASKEARVIYDESNGFLTRLCAEGLADELRSALVRFDWHSQVTIRFVDNDGGAAWSRSNRTITVNSSYVRRFIDQGNRGLPAASN